MKRHSLMMALIALIGFSFLTACASPDTIGRSCSTADRGCCKTCCAKMMEKGQCCCSGMRQGDAQAGRSGGMCDSATMESKKGAHPKNRGQAGVPSVK